MTKNHNSMSRTYQLITSSGIFVLIILFPLSLTASTIVLKNGRTLQGKIINQSRTEVQIEVNGKLQTISKAEISEINLKDPKKEESKKKKLLLPDHPIIQIRLRLNFLGKILDGQSREDLQFFPVGVNGR